MAKLQRTRKANLSIHKKRKVCPIGDYSLTDQIRRASVFVMSNSAEGFERGSNKEFIQFLYISKGSCGEIRSLLYVALDQQYISVEEFLKAKEECVKLAAMINSLIRYLTLKKTNTRQKVENKVKS